MDKITQLKEMWEAAGTLRDKDWLVNKILFESSALHAFEPDSDLCKYCDDKSNIKFKEHNILVCICLRLLEYYTTEYEFAEKAMEKAGMKNWEIISFTDKKDEQQYVCGWDYLETACEDYYRDIAQTNTPPFTDMIELMAFSAVAFKKLQEQTNAKNQ